MSDCCEAASATIFFAVAATDEEFLLIEQNEADFNQLTVGELENLLMCVDNMAGAIITRIAEVEETTVEAVMARLEMEAEE